MSKMSIEENNPVINKSALVKRVSDKLDMTNKLVNEVVSATFDEITDCVAEGVSVRLVGFGTFERRLRRGRQGHNPRDPEEKVYIPAHYVPSFKAGKNLKEATKKD
jgi:DNA-binding protein HU-beta